MPPAFAPMPPPGRTNRMMLLVFGTGVAIGLHLGLLQAFFFRSWVPLGPVLLGSLLFSTVIYVLWRWVYPRLGGRTLPSQLVRQGAVTILALGVVSLVTVELVSLAIGGPSLFGPATGATREITITPAMRQTGARVYVLLPIVPTLLLALIGYHQYWARILRLQDRERLLTEMAATAQLAALRAQINPHFLFNSLNSIAQLIRTDPDNAEACVERLADIFRYILRRGETEFVPLAEELRMAEAYLEIERARFGERLHVDIRTDPRSLIHPIPNLILQPLVENAIKHGLSLKLGGGTIRIDAAVADGLLTLTVRDDGLGMPGATLARVYERGVGLRNLRDRLQRIYGDAHLPQITSEPGAGTQVRLRLPVRTAEAA
jgi:signal transduction histidine kinase